jgi:hypothetical protein
MHWHVVVCIRWLNVMVVLAAPIIPYLGMHCPCSMCRWCVLPCRYGQQSARHDIAATAFVPTSSCHMGPEHTQCPTRGCVIIVIKVKSALLPCFHCSTCQNSGKKCMHDGSMDTSGVAPVACMHSSSRSAWRAGGPCARQAAHACTMLVACLGASWATPRYGSIRGLRGQKPQKRGDATV